MSTLPEKLQATIDLQDAEIAVLRNHIKDLEMALERQRVRADTNEFLASCLKLLAGYKMEVSYTGVMVTVRRGVFATYEHLTRPNDLQCKIAALTGAINKVAKLIRENTEVQL